MTGRRSPYRGPAGRNRSPSGFLLVEAMIATVLVAMLGTALVAILAPLASASADRAAQAQLDAARLAVLGFAMSHGHLPCPATPTVPSGAPGAGIGNPHAGDDCAGGYSGVLPWVTLGVPELDPWGHRIGYHVVREYADARDDCDGATDPKRSICVTRTAPTQWPAHPDALEVRWRHRAGALAGATEPVASGLAFVLVSHGRSGGGGFDASGRRHAAAPATDEQRNAVSGSVSFVMREPLRAASHCADDVAGSRLCAFDDHLAWVSRAEVVRRLVIAGRVR